MATDLKISELTDGGTITPTDEMVVVRAGANVKVSHLNRTSLGFIDYNDVTTQVTPISLTAATETKMTNDGAGVNSNSTYKPDTVTELWDVVSDQLDFTDLILGDQIAIRMDLELTTLSPDTDLILSINFGIGDAGAFQLSVNSSSFKTAGTYKAAPVFIFYVGNAIVKDNPAEIVVEVDKNSTIKVSGWYIKVN